MGTVTITNASTGAYTYTPNAGAMGTDTFVFSVAHAANPTLSTTATITVTVVGITLTGFPPPQLTGTPITLTAKAAGLGTIQYRFVIEYRNADGTWSNHIIDTGYQASPTFVWTPTLPELYTLVAYAKDSVGNNPSTYITYTVQPVEPDRRHPDGQSVRRRSVLGTSITLTAAAQGGITPGNVQYQFLAEYHNPDGSWAPAIMLQDYSTSAQCTWTPQTAQNYTLVVEAELAGATDGYFVTSYITYAITPALLTGVTLSAALPSPQPTATQIVLTANAQGGVAPGNVEYKFVAEYRLANGTWAPVMLLRDYDTNPQCLWTPEDAQAYTLVVYARLVGSTAPYAVYSYIAYTIQPANLTGVTLSANKLSGQPTGTPITLTAAAQGGVAPGTVEYKFVSQYRLTDGTWSPATLLQDYSTTPTCVWTPAAAHAYTLVVFARTVGSTASYNVYSYITYSITP